MTATIIAESSERRQSGKSPDIELKRRKWREKAHRRRQKMRLAGYTESYHGFVFRQRLDRRPASPPAPFADFANSEVETLCRELPPITDEDADALSFSWERCRVNGRPMLMIIGGCRRRIRDPYQSALFGESRTSMLGPKSPSETKPLRRDDPWFEASDYREDSPAAAACLRCDIAEWQSHLSPEQRDVLNCLFEGLNYPDTAQRLHISRFTVAIIVRQLRASWLHFRSLSDAPAA